MSVGDFNMDGIIDQSDTILLSRYVTYVRGNPDSVYNNIYSIFSTSDLNTDGNVDQSDVIKHRRYVTYVEGNPNANPVYANIYAMPEKTYIDNLLSLQPDPTTNTISLTIDKSRITSSISGIQFYVYGIKLVDKTDTFYDMSSKHSSISGWIVASNTLEDTSGGISIVYLEGDGNSVISNDSNVITLATLEYTSISSKYGIIVNTTNPLQTPVIV